MKKNVYPIIPWPVNCVQFRNSSFSIHQQT
jgi:hypothetical protein